MYCIINLSYSRGGKKFMGKLQKLIDNKAQSAKFMCDEIAHICNDMPKRDPGSEGEKWRANIWRTTSNTTAVAKGPPVRIQVDPLILYSFFMLFWENYSFTMQ